MHVDPRTTRCPDREGIAVSSAPVRTISRPAARCHEHVAVRDRRQADERAPDEEEDGHRNAPSTGSSRTAPRHPQKGETEMPTAAVHGMRPVTFGRAWDWFRGIGPAVANTEATPRPAWRPSRSTIRATDCGEAAVSGTSCSQRSVAVRLEKSGQRQTDRRHERPDEVSGVAVEAGERRAIVAASSRRRATKPARRARSGPRSGRACDRA